VARFVTAFFVFSIAAFAAEAPSRFGKLDGALIDLPGHGVRDEPEIGYTQELFARAVDAVMRDAGEESRAIR
jgi:hypothetical protein